MEEGRSAAVFVGHRSLQPESFTSQDLYPLTNGLLKQHQGALQDEEHCCLRAISPELRAVKERKRKHWGSLSARAEQTMPGRSKGEGGKGSKTEGKAGMSVHRCLYRLLVRERRGDGTLAVSSEVLQMRSDLVFVVG